MIVKLIFWALAALAVLLVFAEAGLVASWRAAAQAVERAEQTEDTVPIRGEYQPRHLLPGEETVQIEAARYVPARTALVRRYTRTGA
jgi:hypothetical protein